MFLALMCIPFGGILFSIALGPIVLPKFWDKFKVFIVLFWTVAVIVMMFIGLGLTDTVSVVLECIISDYLVFIVLLFGLYCVAGNITFEGDLAGSPRVNVVLLIIGTFLASIVGTTGASMLMVRPIIKMNSWRRNRSHIMIFFIFLISNMGGSLTPIGDPPLLIGFMQGVPFTWSLKILPVLLFNMIIVLSMFYMIDTKRYRRDIAQGFAPDISSPKTMIKFGGLHNIIFIGMIVGAVISSGMMPDMPMFQNSNGEVLGIKLFADVYLTLPQIIEIAVILIAAKLSFVTTDKELRRKNNMTWNAIQEVALLFIGIFITMQPALMLLKQIGPDLGLTQSAQMFWAAGSLSSFLDNTPTYLVFMTTAGSMGFSEGMSTALGVIPEQMLMAISCGSVFMGAITYIGNAPNFMVKTLSSENGINMPSFFGYMKWSIVCLVPVFVLDTIFFFI
ncbi:MAG: sodium:proton antiporter [Clostridiales bacterium]|nr:sodium:proton antiporter [Clostridiales bacterium]